MPKTHRKHSKTHRKHPKTHRNKSNKKYGGIFGINLIPTSLKFGRSKVADIANKIKNIDIKINKETNESASKIKKLQQELVPLKNELQRIQINKGFSQEAIPAPK